MTKILYEDC